MPQLSSRTQRLQVSPALGSNVVYEYPSIAKLARHMFALCDGTNSSDDVHQRMISLVDRYGDISAPATNGHLAAGPRCIVRSRMTLGADVRRS